MKIVHIEGLTHGIYGELRNNPSRYQAVIDQNEFVVDAYGRWFRDSVHKANSDQTKTVALLSPVSEEEAKALGQLGDTLQSALSMINRSQIGRVSFSELSVEQNFQGGCVVQGRLENTGTSPWFGWGVAPESIDALGIRVLKDDSLVSEQRYHFPFEVLPPGGARDFVWVFTSIDSELEPGSYTLEFDMVREHVGWFSVPKNRPRLECQLYQSGPIDTSTIPSGEHTVALTFDGGSRDTGTAEILDVLSAHDIRCTMFLTGQFIVRQPKLVERMAREGHELANHSMTHPRFAFDFEDFPNPGITRDFLRTQILDVEGVSALPLQKLWRAPFGHSNRLIRSWALAEGYRHIYWSYDSRDWTVGQGARALGAREVCENTVRYLSSLKRIEGEILLYHLMQNTSDPIASHIDQMIHELKKQGVEFMTVGTLISRANATRLPMP